MKKIGILAIFALLLVGFVFAGAETVKPTIVNGHVYASDGHTPVSGASVKVTCNSAEPIMTTTNPEGYYVVEFFGDCNVGDNVTVESGSYKAEGTVNGSRLITKNIAYINLSVPEFGTAAALVALVGSVGLFMFIRKKQ
jgi:hypothetical protein